MSWIPQYPSVFLPCVIFSSLLCFIKSSWTDQSCSPVPALWGDIRFDFILSVFPPFVFDTAQLHALILLVSFYWSPRFSSASLNPRFNFWNVATSVCICILLCGSFRGNVGFCDVLEACCRGSLSYSLAVLFVCSCKRFQTPLDSGGITAQIAYRVCATRAVILSTTTHLWQNHCPRGTFVKGFGLLQCRWHTLGIYRTLTIPQYHRIQQCGDGCVIVVIYHSLVFIDNNLSVAGCFVHLLMFSSSFSHCFSIFRSFGQFKFVVIVANAIFHSE